jgi:hypothetical protein
MSSAGAYTARQFVDKTTQVPKPISVVPTCISTNGPDFILKYILGLLPFSSINEAIFWDFQCIQTCWC